MNRRAENDDFHAITELLHDWSGGDARALDESFPPIHEALHHQARNYLRHDRPDHTLQTTTLLHEAYIRFASHTEGGWENRFHFFAIAATVMRNLLVDHARAKKREKLGAEAWKISIADTDLATPELDLHLLALNEALNRQIKIDEQQLREPRYFGGLSFEATSDALQISRATVARTGI